MYRNKKSGIVGIVITIIILILIVIFSNGEKNASFFENAAANLIMPVSKWTNILKKQTKWKQHIFYRYKQSKRRKQRTNKEKQRT